MGKSIEQSAKKNKPMDMKLSICIPIYNCAEYIRQSLDSIMPQTREDVEVIVYDGGSTDETPALMGEYKKEWENLHYHRGDTRGGIDADMVTCVGFARSQYCWLFSGDDVMRPKAIERALEWIKLGHDVYICKHTICNKKMDVIREYPVLRPDQIFTANLANENERIEWFRRAETNEAFFSFISGLIINREKWESGKLPETFNRSCWGHVARYFGLISTGLTVCYVAEIWLDQRGENDSFADKGIVNRFRIGIEGYHRLADRYFGHESKEAFNIRRVIRNEFTFFVLLNAKILCVKNPTRENRAVLDSLVRMNYCDNLPGTIVKRSVYRAMPYWLVAVARNGYQLLKTILRLQ